MLTKTDFLECVQDPLAMRTLFRDPLVVKKLEGIGIAINIYELHAPSVGAKKEQGLGVTLCGRSRAMRSSVVTCKKCLAKLTK
jgi:hypothetical protein